MLCCYVVCVFSLWSIIHDFYCSRYDYMIWTNVFRYLSNQWFKGRTGYLILWRYSSICSQNWYRGSRLDGIPVMGNLDGMGHWWHNFKTAHAINMFHMSVICIFLTYAINMFHVISPSFGWNFWHVCLLKLFPYIHLEMAWAGSHWTMAESIESSLTTVERFFNKQMCVTIYI